MDQSALGAISVIVPCRDAAPFLGEALESILRQVPSPHEVIVVDDGSKDESASVASSYGNAVRCLSQTSAGIAAARNSGIRAATGQFLAFLDADDIWPANSLAHRLEILTAHAESGYAYGVVETFVDAGVPDDAFAALPPARAARLAGALLVRRSVVDAVGAFDTSFRIGETLDWVARLDEHGIMSRACDHVVLRRRIHAHNTVRHVDTCQHDYLTVMRAALRRRRGDASP